MAYGFWLTNRGVADLFRGHWDVLTSTSWQIGLLSTSQPAAVDTKAEVQQLDYVSDLLITAAAIESAFTGYTRKPLVRTPVAQDDINNRANLVAAPVVWDPAGGAVNELIVGHFIFTEGTGADTSRPLIGVRWYDVADQYTTIGNAFTQPISNLLLGSQI